MKIFQKMLIQLILLQKIKCLLQIKILKIKKKKILKI